MLRSGLKCRCLESKFGRDLDPMTGVEWVDLVCAYGTNGACVLGYPAGIHWFVNRRFCEMIQLGYSLAQ